VAKHIISKGYLIDFIGASILDRTSGQLDRLAKEAIEIHLNKNSFNRDGGFVLSQAWSLVTNMIMNVKAGPSGAGT